MISCVCASILSLVQLLATLWTVACQALLSTSLPRQETGAGCHFLPQRIFLTQGSNPYLRCLQDWQVDSLPLSHLESHDYTGDNEREHL